MIELDTIYNQDCMDGLKLLPDKSIDLILTDPPYGKGYHNGVKPYGANVFGACKQRKYIKSSTPWDKEAPPPKRCSMKCSELLKT